MTLVDHRDGDNGSQFSLPDDFESEDTQTRETSMKGLIISRWHRWFKETISSTRFLLEFVRQNPTEMFDGDSQLLSDPQATDWSWRDWVPVEWNWHVGVLSMFDWWSWCCSVDCVREDTSDTVAVDIPVGNEEQHRYASRSNAIDRSNRNANGSSRLTPCENFAERWHRERSTDCNWANRTLQRPFFPIRCTQTAFVPAPEWYKRRAKEWSRANSRCQRLWKWPLTSKWLYHFPIDSSQSCWHTRCSHSPSCASDWVAVVVSFSNVQHEVIAGRWEYSPHRRYRSERLTSDCRRWSSDRNRCAWIYSWYHIRAHDVSLRCSHRTSRTNRRARETKRSG